MIRYIFLTFFIAPIILSAQAVYPVNANIQVEVLTENKSVDDENQYIQVQLICQTSDEVNALNLRFEDRSARWTVVSAQLNGELLWLLKSSVRAPHENVLAWDFDENADQLNLFPANWQIPYVLDLQLQINMNSTEKPDNPLQEKVIVETSLPTGIYTASPTGRGDIITLR